MSEEVPVTTYTPEQLRKLEEMGFKITYKNKCGLCGKQFTSKNEERLQKRLEEHVDEKCPTARWMRGATKILELAGLKNVIQADLIYLMEGKFPDGCGRVEPEELEILNNVKDMLDNWGKEDKRS